MHVAGAGRMERVDEYQMVIALIVGGLDDGRLRIHVKQDGRDGIAMGRNQPQDGGTQRRCRRHHGANRLGIAVESEIHSYAGHRERPAGQIRGQTGSGDDRGASGGHARQAGGQIEDGYTEADLLGRGREDLQARHSE